MKKHMIRFVCDRCEATSYVLKDEADECEARYWGEHTIGHRVHRAAFDGDRFDTGRQILTYQLCTTCDDRLKRWLEFEGDL